MSERTRVFLRNEFRDGERPSGADFTDLIDSCVNKSDENVSFDPDGNLVLSRGVQLGDSAGTAAGGLRFNSNQLQVFTGGSWVNVSGGGGGGGGAFLPPPVNAVAEAVAHNGNVGIGPAFNTAAAVPTFRLEVQLDANNGPGNQVRLGNVVCANGSGAFAGAAVFSHQGHASNSNYAVRQAANGAVHINAVTGQPVSIRQGGATVRMGVSAAGNVIVGGDSELVGAPAGAVLQVAGDVFKSPSNVWGTSDARVKEDVRDLELGLAELRQVRPVRFRYNGRAGTPAGRVDLGIIAQEIEAIVPETVQRVSVANDPGLDDMRVFDPSALTYVLINAVKELAARVEYLEEALAVATTAVAPGPVIA